MTFKITVKDEFSPELTGEFLALSYHLAIKQARKYYAFELGTYPENIHIVKVESEAFVTYVDEEGNKGEEKLTDFIYTIIMQDDIQKKEYQVLTRIKVGETVRLNGWMGLHTDVTRTK